MKKIKSLMFAIVIGVSFLLSACTDDEPLMGDSKNENSQVTNNQGESANNNDGLIGDIIIDDEDETVDIDSGNTQGENNQGESTSARDEIIGVVMDISQEDDGVQRLSLIEFNSHVGQGFSGFHGRFDTPESEWIYLNLDTSTIIEIEEGENLTRRSGTVADISERDLLRIYLRDGEINENRELSFERIVIMRTHTWEE